MFSKFKDFLWPLGATILAMFVVPIAIEQYPGLFKESPWILPAAVGVVCFCWIIPFLVHQRVKRFHGWVLGQLGANVGWIAVILMAAIIVTLIGVSGYKLYGKHKRHLESRLHAPIPAGEPTIEPTSEQQAFMVKLQKEYDDSIVTVRSIQIDAKGDSLRYVDGTGFFVDDKGLILTTAENLRYPNDTSPKRFEVITSDGVGRETHEVGLAISQYWRLLTINAPSKPLPLSNDPFNPGQTLIILGKSAHSGAIESRLGRVDRDEDPFYLSTETPAGFNGSPIFDERGKVTAVQIFRPETGKSGTLMCLKVPTDKFVEGMASQVIPKAQESAPMPPGPGHHAVPPMIGSARFSVIVPFVPDSPNVPIPMDQNLQDPHYDFYTKLLGLSGRPDNPPKNAPRYKPRNFGDIQEQFIFVTRLVQYYLVDAIDTLRRGQQGTKFINGVGVVPINKDPILFPDAEPYPLSALQRDLSDNDFFIHAVGDQMLWKNNPIKLPKGSKLELVEQNEPGKPFVAYVSIERKGYYAVRFSIEPFGAMHSQLPAGFGTIGQGPKADSHNITITMNYMIEQRADPDFNPHNYAEWAKALVIGLKDLTGFN
jgi:hypothetical protein